MNVELKNTDAVNAIITVTVAKDDYAERVEKKLKEYRRKANVPGFRPGMVPMGMIKKMYGKAVTAEEVNELLSDALYDYIKKEKLDVLGDPLPNENEQKTIDFDTDEPLEFVFDIALAPAFELNLTKKDKIAYYDITITDEMIDSQVKTYAGRFGSYESADTVEEHDVLKGNATEVGNDNRKLDDVILAPMHLKDDEQKKLFIGKKAGDIVTFNPQKAMSENELAAFLKLSKDEAQAVTADFNFEIKQITRYKEAAIDQTLFDKAFPNAGIKDEAAFRAKLAEGLKESYVSDSEYKFGLDAKEALVKKMDGIEFPEAFLKRWVLATNKKMTAEEVDKEFDTMLKDLKWYIIKDKLAKKADIKVEEADIDNIARKLAKIQWAQYGMLNVPDDMLTNYVAEMKKKPETLKNLAEKALEDKVLAAIKEQVKLDTKAISYQDFNKMFE